VRIAMKGAVKTSVAPHSSRACHEVRFGRHSADDEHRQTRAVPPMRNMPRRELRTGDRYTGYREHTDVGGGCMAPPNRAARVG